MGSNDSNRDLIEAAKKIVEDHFDPDMVTQGDFIDSLKLLRKVLLDHPQKEEHYAFPVEVVLSILDLAL